MVTYTLLDMAMDDDEKRRDERGLVDFLQAKEVEAANGWMKVVWKGEGEENRGAEAAERKQVEVMATRGIDRSGAAILLRCSNDEPRTVTGRLGRGLLAKRGRDGGTGMIQPANSNTRRGTRDSTSDNATPDLSACWVIDRDRQGRANHTEARRGGRGQLCSALPWTRRQGREKLRDGLWPWEPYQQHTQIVGC